MGPYPILINESGAQGTMGMSIGTPTELPTPFFIGKVQIKNE